jgi:deoxyhypusine synthase
MPYNFEPLDFKKLKTYPLKERKNKVCMDYLGKVCPAGSSVKQLVASLPDILAAQDFKAIVKAWAQAYKNKKTVILGMGAHVIKCGLSPVVIDLLKRGLVQSIALNGAGSVHDVELAMQGCTSEDVASGIETGMFGMVKETGEFLNSAADYAYAQKIGLGEALGLRINQSNFEYKDISILAQAFKHQVPVTVHLTFGGDINHPHPSANGEALGWGTFYDFRLICGVMTTVQEGSLILLLGSSVVIPVVIEKAINAARNQGFKVEKFTGVNMDFIKHYRSGLNPVQRAKDLGGKGYTLVGHHELMLPLLCAAVSEEISE